jgi:hypothetical protein
VFVLAFSELITVVDTDIALINIFALNTVTGEARVTFALETTGSIDAAGIFVTVVKHH